jgi:hypothetical protein
MLKYHGRIKLQPQHLTPTLEHITLLLKHIIGGKMEQLKNIVRLKTVRGESIVTDNNIITPLSQALIVRFPFGGLIWNRPVAIEVDTGKDIRRLPIVDITLAIQIGIFTVGAMLTVIYWLIGRRR